MKQQLETVREALKFIANRRGGLGTMLYLAQEALTALDAYIEGMGSEEMVERVASVLRRDLTDRRGIRQAIEECDDDIQEEIFETNAKAAINAIMGE